MSCAPRRVCCSALNPKATRFAPHLLTGNSSGRCSRHALSLVLEQMRMTLMATIAICLTRTKGAPCTACLRSSEPYLCMAQCPLRCCRRKYVCTEDPKELAWLMGVEEKDLKSGPKPDDLELVECHEEWCRGVSKRLVRPTALLQARRGLRGPHLDGQLTYRAAPFGHAGATQGRRSGCVRRMQKRSRRRPGASSTRFRG